MQQIIPLTPNPNQSLIVPVNINGSVTDYIITLSYNGIAGYWVLNIYDINNNLLLGSVPLVTGEFPSANILSQFGYLGIGSIYILNNSNVQNPPYPNSADLGSDYVLCWTDN